MSGKTVVVTGANRGIGREIALGLARRGATVVIAARDHAPRSGSGAADVLPLDVSDLTSIRAFAEAFQDRYGTLDVLVNNAGAWFTDRRVSAQGLELTFATNVLGPYLLTELLQGPLGAAGRARVLNVVSSIAGSYDAADLQFSQRAFDGYKAYAQSKLALRMLTWGQAERFAGARITANAVAPGFVRSDLNRNAHGMRAAMINLSARLFADSPAKGADTPLWAAVAPELQDVSGKYFLKRQERDGKFRDPAMIAELERRCRELASQVPAA